MAKIKFFIAFVLTFLFAGNLYASQKIEVKSKIAEVTVYPRSALINRVTSLELKKGDYKVVFPNIIPEIDENSLRISAQGQAQVKLFGAQVKKEFLEEIPTEKIKQLEEEIQKLRDEIKTLQSLKDLFSEKKNFLDSIKLFSHSQIPKDLITKMPTPQDLGEILKFLDTNLRENYSQIIKTDLQIREKQKNIKVLQRELNQIRGPIKKIKRSISVELQIQKAGSLDLTVAYLVKGASWQPIYDARASFEKNEVELVSYGIVKQKTGEDWEDVEICLSTAKPAIGGRMPYVKPWVLRPYQPPLRKMALKRRVALQYEAFNEISARRENLLAKPEYAKAEEKGIAVVYKLPRNATVKSDGSEHKLPISSQILKAKFAYSTYPRASNFAYLGSRVSNSPELQLLAGRVNIFLEGDFVGSSSINNIAPSEEFDLYLGIDENVKVKRQCLEKKVDETLIAGVSARTRRTTLKYKLNVENYKSKKINVKLFEAMPVSEDERIKVKIKDISQKPNQKDWKDRKGIWLWELELKPKAKQEIFYTLIIEHPRKMQVEGLRKEFYY